jgi:UDP-GlcNAc:undecaprenyl-phosphate GlcNAc-1-phosphate transferase
MSHWIVIMGCIYATTVSVALCAKADVITPWLRLIDHPTGRKHHASPTPLIGGVNMLAAILPALIAVCWQFGSILPVNAVAFLLAIAVLTLLGIADDRDDHSVAIRLAIAALLFAGISATDPVLRIDQIAFTTPKITFVIDRKWLDVVLSTFCYVGLINAINMADGKNGLVPGLNCIWLGYLLYLTPSVYAPLILIPLLGLLALLPFNLKGRVFLGDGGAYGLAALTALLTVMVYKYHNPGGVRAISADQIWLLFLIPVIDPFRLIYVRFRDGKTPMTPGRDHFHHHLQNWLGWPRGLFVYWGIVALPAGLNIFLGINSMVLLVVTCMGYAFLLSKGAASTDVTFATRPRHTDRSG